MIILTEFLLILFPLPDAEAKKRVGQLLLPWSVANERGSWDVILLMGGGYALSTMLKSSGLSSIIADALANIGSLSTFGIVYCLTLMCTLITEVVSNTATVTIALPIMFQLVSTPRQPSHLLFQPGI